MRAEDCEGSIKANSCEWYLRIRGLTSRYRKSRCLHPLIVRHQNSELPGKSIQYLESCPKTWIVVDHPR